MAKVIGAYYCSLTRNGRCGDLDDVKRLTKLMGWEQEGGIGVESEDEGLFYIAIPEELAFRLDDGDEVEIRARIGREQLVLTISTP